MDPRTLEIIRKYGLDKNGNTVNPGGFSMSRFAERPKREKVKSVMVSEPDISVAESEERYKKSIEEGTKDYKKSLTGMFREIGRDNLKASSNRFKKGDAVSAVFLQEDPEPPKMSYDPKNINLSASLSEMKKINEERKRLDEEGNYNLNKVECQNLKYATSYKDKATMKVVEEREKQGWSSNYSTKKELGNTKKETKIASVNENEFILRRMKQNKPGFTHLTMKTGIVENTTTHEAEEQKSVMNSNSVKIRDIRIEEDIIADELKVAEKIESEESLINHAIN
jgi:hypothetical protein